MLERALESEVSPPDDDDFAPRELTRLLHLSDRREPAVAEIAVWVAQSIIEGKLLPGQPLNSVDLAHQFGTSRTPVREALAVLESDGLVEMRARKRPRVVELGPERIREVFFLRATIMAALTREAATHVDADGLARISGFVDDLARYARADNDDQYRWAHFRFFDAIVDISGNRTAQGILNSLFLRTLSIRQALASPARLQESAEYARQILQSFARRDGELAALLVRRSIEATLRAIDQPELDYPTP